MPKYQLPMDLISSFVLFSVKLTTMMRKHSDVRNKSKDFS